jgi:hypothetical protein
MSNSFLGGVAYVKCCSGFSVVNVTISQINGKCGAAFYLCGLNAWISSWSFSFLSSVGGCGGAIFFGEKVDFPLMMCIYFYFCIIN